MFVMGFFETNWQFLMLLIISDRTRNLAVQSRKTGVYRVQLQAKGFTSNTHLFAGYFGDHIVQTVHCAFYLWLLDMAESYFNYLTVS